MSVPSREAIDPARVLVTGVLRTDRVAAAGLRRLVVTSDAGHDAWQWITEINLFGADRGTRPRGRRTTS